MHNCIQNCLDFGYNYGFDTSLPSLSFIRKGEIIRLSSFRYEMIMAELLTNLSVQRKLRYLI